MYLRRDYYGRSKLHVSTTRSYISVSLPLPNSISQTWEQILQRFIGRARRLSWQASRSSTGVWPKIARVPSVGQLVRRRANFALSSLAIEFHSSRGFISLESLSPRAMTLQTWRMDSSRRKKTQTSEQSTLSATAVFTYSPLKIAGSRVLRQW